MRRILTLLLVAFAAALQAAPLTDAGRKALSVYQIVDDQSGDLVTTVDARYGTPSMGGSGVSLDYFAKKIPNPSSVGTLPIRSYPAGMTQSQVLAAAKDHIFANAPALFASIKSFMKANGVSVASFTFQQKVYISSLTRPKYIVWSAIIDAQSRPMYRDPVLADELPMILQAVYTSKRVMDGLPSSWSYSEGGILKYRLLDMQLQPQTSWTSIDTGGAFDEPQPGDNVAYDPDFGVKCLANKASSPSCPQGYPDMKALIDQTGAIAGILDYVRMVQPVYDQDPATGDLIARAAISVDKRTLNYAGCTSSASNLYSNEGRIGYTLITTVDRYMVAADGAYAYLNQFNGTSISPTESYSASLSVSGTASDLNAKIIEPKSNPAQLVDVSASPWNRMVVYLDPITVTGNTSQTLGVVNAPTLYAETSCDTSRPGWFKVSAIIPPGEQCHAGGCNSDYFWIERWFQFGTPASYSPANSARTYRGYWWEPIGISYDGGGSVSFSGYGTETGPSSEDGGYQCYYYEWTAYCGYTYWIVYYTTPSMPLDGISRSYTYSTLPKRREGPYFYYDSGGG
ncbi:hypothetical protein [Pelomicrobium methylotrophicum]|uniref:Uncharacterized protein n=1 Tax=Pelomicrobium methylotrophicum TaxID=2602750 RepID=A0A5C7ESD3_9PROT|nr:hypothetical protein [Pelomicrobium methylotrophicum]TXF11577.1 hypothetical protein FR698_09565 [Pelomicrobium methylotrophicum]